MRGLILLALLLMPAALGAEPVRELREIRSTEPVSIRSDKAYFLLRISDRPGVWEFGPVFLRIPTASEMEAYYAEKRSAYANELPKLEKERQRLIAAKTAAEARGERPDKEIPPVPTLQTFNFLYGAVHNVTPLAGSKYFTRTGEESTYLVEAQPGDYVLYGASYANGRAGLYVCMCLGTVGFSAKAGQVTDLGEFLSDVAKFRSKVPELEAESGFGPSSDMPFPLAVAAVKPTQPGASVPAVLSGIPIHAADYRAIGKFLEPRTGGINRLVPIPGVLAYDGDGHVIDVKTGTVAPDRF